MKNKTPIIVCVLRVYVPYHNCTADQMKGSRIKNEVKSIPGEIITKTNFLKG